MNVTGNNTQHDLLSKCDKNSTGVSAAEEFWRYVRLPMLTVFLLRMCECVLILLVFCCCCCSPFFEVVVVVVLLIWCTLPASNSSGREVKLIKEMYIYIHSLNFALC